MEANIKTVNPQEAINKARICEEIFDSVTIYMHITTIEEWSPSSGESQHDKDKKGLSTLSFSNIPFSDPKWKDNLFNMNINIDALLSDVHEEKAVSYNLHIKLLLDMAYMLTIRGHEVQVCLSQNPTEKNGDYMLFSDSIKDFLSKIKESETEKVL